MIIIRLWYALGWRFVVFLPVLSAGLIAAADTATDLPRIIVDTGHPWRPPFGINRVGAPLQAHVELGALPGPDQRCVVITYRDGRQAEVHPMVFTGPKAPFWSTVELKAIPDEIAVALENVAAGQIQELRRQPVTQPELAVEAVVRPNRVINPVDLGAVFVPHDWLLLAKGQDATVEIAALSRLRAIPAGRLKAWFGDGPALESAFALEPGQRATATLPLRYREAREKDVLHVAFLDQGRILWQREFRVMFIPEAPRRPSFGAVETKLRYDAPISVIDSTSGKELPPLDYNTAWDPKLKDVVVFLPNGSRFVFWRGTNYVPFWAGTRNTGVCYQWAENLSVPIFHADGTRDFPEPLYDFELRYGSVRIVESTPSRVHVQWTYQATDVNYRVWGDQAREDFYFYPDGFGTRVLTITSKPKSRYQLSEFIILTPQSAFPMQVIPEHIVDVLFLDGEKVSLLTPFERKIDPATGKQRKEWPKSRDQPAIFRIFAAKDDPAAAIYFHSDDKAMGLFSFQGLYDRGELVSPVYWGSHWPLARGKITAYAIDDRINKSPAHNSIGGWLPQSDGKGGWGNWEVRPFESNKLTTLNSLGHAVEMEFNRWSWLIAKTDATDETLLRWAKSFSAPPSLGLTGAEPALPSYSPDRRAIRLVVKSGTVGVRIMPTTWTMNPVFELTGAPRDLQQVALDGRKLGPGEYAWDGGTLWLNVTVGATGAQLELKFHNETGKAR